MPLWLGESDVRASLDVVQLIDSMESALAAFSTGMVAQPVRTAIETGDRSFFAVMPAFDNVHAVLGAKLVTIVPGNEERGLHTHLAAISLFNSETGELTAVLDGRYITEVRTAAVSAVSVRRLVAGRTVGRASASEVTVFKSLGLAIEDVVAANLAFRNACQNHRGIRLTLD